MCGLATYFSTENVNDGVRKLFDNSLKSINHRGPDSMGVFEINTRKRQNVLLQNNLEELQPNLLLGHVRLSIIDVTEAGHQPMHYLNYTIVFNGEIYNYIEIRDELLTYGYEFKTNSDTEVILAAYDKWKEKCLSKFNGMFSIIIYDNVENYLFIANDRFGVKPLYYYKYKNSLIFASEIKQFYSFKLSLSINSEAIETFATKGFIDHNNETFYNEVRRFPKASFSKLHLDDNFESLNFQNYYNLPNSIIQNKNYLEEFEYIFSDAVKLRLRSDVPLGFASSGGLDSSSILYKAFQILKSENNHLAVNTFSAIFPAMSGDESEYIKFIENDLKVKSHYTNPLELFSIEDFEKHIYHQDLPITSTSYYAEWCVARLVHNSGVKVLLIGQGGDELLAGYHHHFYRYCRQLILQGKLVKYLSEAKSFAEIKNIKVNDLHKMILNEVKISIKFKLGLINMNSSLEKHWNSANKLIELLKIDFSYAMLPTYLRSDDRDSMAFGLETRHPFLDYRLVDFCFSMPDELKIKNGWQKNILRESMTHLPEKIRYRKDKKGYTTPETEWIKKHKQDFDSYLNYIPEELKQFKSSNPFLNYSLGAWFKLNNIK
jgi:asparagine synthase (glutamine-hydrolysing)